MTLGGRSRRRRDALNSGGVPRRPAAELLLIAVDEMFFCGTAAEVTPVRSVDRIEIGAGVAGPITLEIQKRFLETVRGENDDPHGYLTVVGD